MMSDAIRAVILGIVEGVTEFLPVSSTGHMLLVKRFFGLGEGAFWDSFVVLIQLGAILAIVVIYFAKLWRIALGMFSNADDRRFVIGVLVAFLPAAVIGAAAGSYIKIYLARFCYGSISSITIRMSTMPRHFRCRCIWRSDSRSVWR
jgi:undecaprenyl-diphosphatase